MGLIFALSAQPDLPHPDSRWWDWAISSGAHAFMFGVLAVLWARALKGRRAWLPALLLTVAYGLSDEIHQMFVPGRHADPLDLLFDAGGAGVALIVWAWARRRRTSADSSLRPAHSPDGGPPVL